MDNRAVAQVLGEIADLLEIKAENIFKIRAYRSAAETIAGWPEAVSRMTDVQLRAVPGIGKDLALKVRELADTGVCDVHQELLQAFPPTILDVLRLQGIGPKTVGLLYAELNICSVDELAVAAREGRLRTVKGMGVKKEAQILKAIAERQRDAGRHLLSHTAAVAVELLDYLEAQAPSMAFAPVGSLRRGAETCGDVDVLAVGSDAGVVDTFVAYAAVERVLAYGDAASTVLLKGGYQADLQLVPAESRGAALQCFTGSKAHNGALGDLALARGLTLNEHGLFRLADQVRIAGETEESIYEALGLAWIPPELREHRGEIEAAAAGALPRLVTRADLRGDLHMHTTVTDGRDDLLTMCSAARQLGHQYIAITEHSKALAMANGLDERRALEHAARVRALNGRFDGLTLLAGIECDILADGSMDLSPDCLAELDIVIASVHSAFTQEPQQLTDRVLRALECPWVDVLGHPTARRLLRREPLRLDVEAIIEAAARSGVAMEINCQVNRLDLSDVNARLAREHGVPLVISTDAHATSELANLSWGLQMARRAWATPDDVLNTRSVDAMRQRLRRNRGR